MSKIYGSESMFLRRFFAVYFAYAFRVVFSFVFVGLFVVDFGHTYSFLSYIIVGSGFEIYSFYSFYLIYFSWVGLVETSTKV